MSGLAEALKQRRSELGYTLAQVADMVGVTEATVQRWESGNIKALRHGRIAKLAEALQTTPAYLMGWEDNLPSDAIPCTAFSRIPCISALGATLCVTMQIKKAPHLNQKVKGHNRTVPRGDHTGL